MRVLLNNLLRGARSEVVSQPVRQMPCGHGGGNG